MKLDVIPLPLFGAVFSWDFSKAPSLDAIDALRMAVVEHKMLICRQRWLEPAKLIEFTRLFGSRLFIGGKAFQHSPQYKEVICITNQPNEVLKTCACESWHCDGHYLSDPCAVTVMNMVPAAGGAISVCDIQAAYERMPDVLKPKLQTLRLKNESSGVIQPLVKPHPVTGRLGFYINMYARTIDRAGHYLPEFDAVLEQILAEQYYNHQWQTGDIMVVDNFSVTHKVCPGDPSKLEVLQRAQTTESGSWWRSQPNVLESGNDAYPAIAS